MFDKVVRGGAAVLIRQMISFPINFVGVTLASRILRPDDFAFNAILVPAVGLALLAIDWGTSQALIQAYNPASPGLLRRIQWQKLLAGLVAVFVLLIFSSDLASYWDAPPSLILLFPVAGLIGWLQSQRAYQAVRLQRQVDWSALARVELIEIIVYNAALVISAYLLRSAWAFAVAMGLRALVGSVLLRVNSMREKTPEPPAAEMTTNMKPLLQFGVPMQLTAFLGILNGLANPVILGGLLGAYSVGLINWSNNIVNMPRVPMRPFPLFLFSVLSERRRRGQSDQEVLSSLAFLGVVSVALISLLVILILDILVQNVFGSQWQEAIPLVAILMLGNIIFVPAMLVRAQIQAAGYSSLWLTANIASTAIVWVAGYFVTRSFGATGFAITMVFAAVVAFAILTYSSRIRLQLNVSLIDSLYMILVVSASTIVSYYLKSQANIFSSEQVAYVIAVAAGLVIFVLTTLPFILIRRDKVNLLVDLFRSSRKRYSDGLSSV